MTLKSLEKSPLKYACCMYICTFQSLLPSFSFYEMFWRAGEHSKDILPPIISPQIVRKNKALPRARWPEPCCFRWGVDEHVTTFGCLVFCCDTS